MGKNILYRQLRNQIKPWHCQEFIDFIHWKYPDKDPHHLLGSLGSMKITDLLIAPLQREEHGVADQHREQYFETYLPKALNLVQEFVDHLLSRE